MSRLTLQRTVGGLVLVLGLAAFAVGDPPAPAAKDTPAKGLAAKDDGAKRLLYILKHGSAKDVAAVLAEHFKGVADIQALPDSTSNCLLISAAPSALDEVVKVLDLLDHRPLSVLVEIVIAEVAVKKADGDRAAPAEQVDEKDFAGALADVDARVDALQKKGVLGEVKRIRLIAVEGMPASAMIGENRPFVAALNVTRTGQAMRSITYRNEGVQADTTVRVSPDKVVTVDLKLEDSPPSNPDNGVPLGNDENGKPVLAPEFAMSKLTNKLDVPSGKALVAQGVKTVGGSDKTHMLVIVGAQVLEPDAKTDK